MAVELRNRFRVHSLPMRECKGRQKGGRPSSDNKINQLLLLNLANNNPFHSDTKQYLKINNPKKFKTIINTKTTMQVIQFFTKKKPEQLEPLQFTPSIIISPSSTLFIQCTPNDPHTASNIVINCYPSKTDRSLLQARIQWRRFKILTDTEHTNTQLPFITGNAYRCEPADLGFYIQAKIVSVDIACNGSAEVTIGPIRLDPTVKSLVEGALYSRQLRSHVKILQKNETRNAEMRLQDRFIRIADEITGKQLEMAYDMSEPRIEINPKDPTKIFLRFEQDQSNKVQKWLEAICEKNQNFDTQSRRSVNSQGSAGSSSRIFKGSGSVNKIQLAFLTRHSRDQFIFSMRAFVCREEVKNSAAMESLQNVSEMRTPADAFKFFQFMSYKSQIYRLANLVKQLQKELSRKIRDLEQAEDNFAQASTQYILMIEKKAKQFNIDLNQSHSYIGQKRQQVLGKKQMRELAAENQKLKDLLRQKHEELQFKELMQHKNNESMMLNQTNSNPFAKKNMNSSYYGPNMANEGEEPKQQSPNVAELTKSYLNLLKQHEKLKDQKKIFVQNQNQSMSKDQDMLNLLQSLHQSDEEPSALIQRLKTENKTLKAKVQELTESLRRTRPQPGIIKLNQSVAYQQQQEKKDRTYMAPQEESYISRVEGSFMSLSQSNLNDSITSEAALMALENKVREIGMKNKEVLAENERLRGQRDRYRQECQKLRKNSSASNLIEHRSVLSTSNFFDPEGLKQQNENLINERNSLLRKIQSLTKESSKGGDPLLERKCEELTKENNHLRKENQSLRQRIQSMKSESISSAFYGENYRQNDRLKKINSQLLEEIKNLKLEIERKANPLYNSRVIELENQLNFMKSSGGNGDGVQKATQDLLVQISRLQKDVQRLTRDNDDKDAKIQSQNTLIQRLMNTSQCQNSQSLIGKDKSYSETRNDSESNQKLKKKIRELQEQIVMLRRSADLLNQSQDRSMEMMSYNEEQVDLLKRERDMLLMQTEKLNRMCDKYCKELKEANRELTKWKQQAFELMKIQQPKEQPQK